MAEWYAEGLRFTCTQCGNCCTGPTGAVWFTEDEGKAMSEKLGISEDAFYKQFARKIGQRWSLKEQVIDDQFDCIFLDRSGGLPSCSLYEVRPTQCKTWPFWGDVLKSPESWQRAKRSTPCHGMDSGQLIPVEQIRIYRDQ